MQKRFLLMVCGLLAAGLLMLPAGAATFENIDENVVSSTFLNHNFDCGGVTGGTATQSLGGIVVRDIQHWDSAPPSILYNSQDGVNNGWGVTDTSCPSGSTSFTLSKSGNTISTGIISYNILYNTLGNPSHINVWMEFDNWDSKGYTGQQSLTLTYNRTNINGLGVGGTYRGNIPPPSDPWGMYFIFSVSYSRYNGGYIIINEDYNWKNNIIITPNHGENPTQFNIQIDRFSQYVSRSRIYTSTFNYIDDYSINDLEINTYEYPIYIDIQDLNNVWHNNTYYNFGTSSNYWTLTLSNDEPNKYEIITATLKEEAGAPELDDIIYYQLPSSYELPIYGNYDEDHLRVQYRQINGTWYKYNATSMTFDLAVTEEDAFSWETKFYKTGSFQAIAYLVSDSPFTVTTLSIPVTVTEEEVEEGIITFRPYDASTGAALWCEYELYDVTVDDTYRGGGSKHTILAPISHYYVYNAYLVNYENATWSGIFQEDGEEHVVYLHRSTSAGGAEAEVEIVAVNEEGLVIGSTVFQVSNSTWSKTRIGEYVRFTVLQNHEYTWKASKSGYGSATGTFNLSTDYKYIEASLTGAGVTATPIPTTGLAGSGSGLDVREESRQSVRDTLTQAFDIIPSLFFFFLLLLLLAAIKKV